MIKRHKMSQIRNTTNDIIEKTSHSPSRNLKLEQLHSICGVNGIGFDFAIGISIVHVNVKCENKHETGRAKVHSFEEYCKR